MAPPQAAEDRHWLTHSPFEHAALDPFTSNDGSSSKANSIAGKECSFPRIQQCIALLPVFALAIGEGSADRPVCRDKREWHGSG